jgi:hypothetical protein
MWEGGRVYRPHEVSEPGLAFHTFVKLQGGDVVAIVDRIADHVNEPDGLDRYLTREGHPKLRVSRLMIILSSTVTQPPDGPEMQRAPLETEARYRR